MCILQPTAFLNLVTASPAQKLLLARIDAKMLSEPLLCPLSSLSTPHCSPRQNFLFLECATGSHSLGPVLYLELIPFTVWQAPAHPLGPVPEL